MGTDSFKMCYTCLQDVTSLVDLQEEDMDNITYTAKLSKLIAFKLIAQEAMGICTACADQLRVSYKFLETVTFSQNSWKRYLEEFSFKTEEIEIEDKFSYGAANNESDSFKLNVKEEEYNSSCNNYPFNNDMLYISEVKYEESNNDNNFKCTKCSKVYSREEMLSHECFKSSDKSDEVCGSDANTLKKSKTKKNSTVKKEITKKYDKSAKKSKNKKTKEVSYECPVCEMLFNKRWILRKHVVRVHTSEKKFNCNICGKSFKQSYHLKEHQTCHTGEKKFSCDFCEKNFKRSSSLKRHMKSHDQPPGQKTKRTPFLCNICGKSFPFSNGVQRHMRVHLGIKKHKCEICQKMFRQSTHLHVHMRTHTGEKPYICDTCGEPFALKARLEKHISSFHEGVPSEPCDLPLNLIFMCGFCGQNYTNNDDLQTHIDIHKSELEAEVEDIKDFTSEDLKNYQILPEEIPYTF